MTLCQFVTVIYFTISYASKFQENTKAVISKDGPYCAMLVDEYFCLFFKIVSIIHILVALGKYHLSFPLGETSPKNRWEFRGAFRQGNDKRPP